MATLRHRFLAQASRSKSSGCLRHTYSIRPGRDMAATIVLCASCLWQQGSAGICNRLGCTRSGGSPSHCPQSQGLVCGETSHYGDPVPCASLNNGTSLPRQSVFPPGAVLAVELLSPIPSGCLGTADLHTPIPSGHLYAANSSPLPGSALFIPCFSTQPPPALVDVLLRLGCAVF